MGVSLARGLSQMEAGTDSVQYSLSVTHAGAIRSRSEAAWTKVTQLLSNQAGGLPGNFEINSRVQINETI